MHHPQLRSVFFLALALVSANTLADNNRGFFAGGNLNYLQANDLLPNNATEEKLNLSAIELMGGYKYNPWLGVDVRLGFGLTDGETELMSDADVPVATGSNTYSMDSYQSIYYRPEILNETARFYGLIGYSSVTTKTDMYNIDDEKTGSEELSTSGVSLGFGAGWFIDEHLNFNIELKSLANADKTSINAVTAGIDYRF